MTELVNPRKIYIVYAVTDYEDTSTLCAFMSKKRAEKYCAMLNEYHEANPYLLSDPDDDEKLLDEHEKWAENHPSKGHAYCDRFVVSEEVLYD